MSIGPSKTCTVVYLLFSEKMKRPHRCLVVFRLQRLILQVASAQNLVQPSRMLLHIEILLNVDICNSRIDCLGIVALS
jgi:hypothetical protein